MTTDARVMRATTDSARWLVAVSLVLTLGCAEEPSSPSGGSPLRLPVTARATTADIVVSSTAPDSATQDTTLDVTINGSGFDADSKATWAIGGVSDSTQVRTNSTRYVNSRTLVANITLSATATIGKWDVIIMSKSKGGIGTELFTVKVRGNVDSDSRALIVFDTVIDVAAPGATANMQAAGVVSDGRDEKGIASTNPRYQGGFCGVRAKIFTGPNESGDLVFDPDIDPVNGTVCGSRRTLLFYLSYQTGGLRGSATPVASFSNARAIHQLAAGQVVSELGGFGQTGLTGCSRIAFEHATYPSSANIRVTRLPDVNGARQWRVESEYPHVGMCTYSRGGKIVANGTKYLPFAYTVTEIPSPYPTYP